MKRKFYLVDLFCGAGGTSTAAEQAGIKIVACINHDAKAIRSHELNHPNCLHLIEDIRTVGLEPIQKIVQDIRASDTDAIIILWASLECTNFSNAKGGKSRNADSRSLADHLFRYIDALRPDYVGIENVREFMCWGDLDEKGKPISRVNGKLYQKWVNDVKEYGYDHDWRILNSANFGAYQKRKRYFAWFARTGLPIQFPQPTHGETSTKATLFDAPLLPLKPVSDILHLEKHGQCIFNRKKPLSDNTLLRIYYGLQKHDKVFVVQRFSGQPKSRSYSISEPMRTVMPTDHNHLVNVTHTNAFITQAYGTQPQYKNQSIHEPLNAITTVNKHELVTTMFMQYNGAPKRQNIYPITQPLNTVTTVSRFATVNMIMQYNGKCTLNDLEEPMNTVTVFNAQRFVSFIINPQWRKDNATAITQPLPTVIASQDKMPFSLVFGFQGCLFPKITASDTKVAKALKWLMFKKSILQINMRMFEIDELLRAQGFPVDYAFDATATKADKTKFIGNAVQVDVGRALFLAITNF